MRFQVANHGLDFYIDSTDGSQKSHAPVVVAKLDFTPKGKPLTGRTFARARDAKRAILSYIGGAANAVILKPVVVL